MKRSVSASSLRLGVFAGTLGCANRRSSRRYAALVGWGVPPRGFRLRLHPRLKADRRFATPNFQLSPFKGGAPPARGDVGDLFPGFRFAAPGANLCRPFGAKNNGPIPKNLCMLRALRGEFRSGGRLAACRPFGARNNEPFPKNLCILCALRREFWSGQGCPIGIAQDRDTDP